MFSSRLGSLEEIDSRVVMSPILAGLTLRTNCCIFRLCEDLSLSRGEEWN